MPNNYIDEQVKALREKYVTQASQFGHENAFIHDLFDEVENALRLSLQNLEALHRKEMEEVRDNKA